ncbi:hypothetical protein HY968_03665 [Candidatus Kaiserbacteria bacterium]|nr:hypothetical protein [Candidatus Kaiserbacteria bacterium]
MEKAIKQLASAVKKVAENLKDVMETVNFMKDRMVTKSELKESEDRVKTELKKTEDRLRSEFHQEISEAKDDLRRVTKDTVQMAKDEVLEAIHPTEKAVDKDSVTLVDHGRRLVRIEKHLAL